MNKLLITICPICDSKKIKKIIGNLNCKRDKHYFTVPNITYYFCQSCGEKLTDVENEIKIDNQRCCDSTHKQKKAA
ncbi:MAG: YgiT-type zinc finger protein [Bdellovibrio sp.]|nr:YgiT-type zinc finger protein [Bdellovibrio sp.]